jgi:serine/threonine-protein kinase
MRHLSLGSFTCPHCGESHTRTAKSCPRTGELLVAVHKHAGTILEQRYKIRQMVAEGGMGAIYRARHKQTDATLAVKFLNPDACQTRETYERFMREARIAASIDHPGIVQILDLGITQDGTPYIVMEYLKGEDLSSQIDRAGLLDVGVSVSITEQILEALKAVHMAGIVHRDLKPENVFLARQSGGGTVVKLLDFGVSRLVQDDEQVTRLTESGKVYGTPHYVSPGQACGDRDADHRSDLYSVAVILYEMLVGEPPFDAASPARLIIDIATAPPPNPLEKRPDMPPALAGFILRGLEKEPASRFQSAHEMVRELRIARNTRPLRPRGKRPRASKPVTSGSYRIIGPPEEAVAPRVPYNHLIGASVVPGPSGVERTGSRPAARRELARTQPVNRSRQPTPGHRSEITPNPDMGEPED